MLWFFPVVMYGCESSIKKAEHWRIDTFELWCWRRLLRVFCKEIKPVNPKGNQSWVFIGRTDAEAEAPIFWLPEAKNWLIRKNHDAVEDGIQEEKGTTESEIVGWHHQLNGHESEQAPGDGEGKGSLVCCNPWGCRVWHHWSTEQLPSPPNSVPPLHDALHDHLPFKVSG